MKKRVLPAAAAAAVLLSACAGSAQPAQTSSVESVTVSSAASVAESGTSYEQITQETAQEIMDSGEDIIILDVRTQEEFSEEHIPGAICVPNETIADSDIPQLPDKQQTILVYCRSGRRSKEASQKLAALGYTGIKEFGGIIDWQGKTEKGDN